MLSDEDFLEDAPFDEAERHRLILADIEKNIERCGEHHAVRGSKRATQFMPFDALTGFGELMAEEERKSSEPADFAGPEVFDTP